MVDLAAPQFTLEGDAPHDPQAQRVRERGENARERGLSRIGVIPSSAPWRSTDSGASTKEIPEPLLIAILGNIK